MKGLLHIGMPKCMSTALQAFLREAKGVHFMGIGLSKFVERDVLHAMQRQIIRTSSHLYDGDAVKQTFDVAMARARTSGARVVALSDELIPFPLSYGLVDTSYRERLQRLKAVMPEPTVVLMLVRQPAAYLKSVYKYESTSHGLSMTYEEFLRRLIMKGDTAFLSTVKYFDFAREARDVFGEVQVIAMEEIAVNKRALTGFFAGLGVPMPELPPRENVGLADEKFENFRELLAPYGSSLANNDFNVISPAERVMALANQQYFGSIYAEVLTRDQALASMRTLAAQLPDRPDGKSLAMSEATREKLAAYVAKSNAGLKEQFGVDIDTHGYDRF